MILKVKLKHLNTIVSENIDYKELIEDIEGFKKIPFLKKARFTWKFRRIYPLIKQIQHIDPTKVTYDDLCEIKLPNHIDNITFQAMMEAQALSNKDITIAESIRDIISIVCYQANNEGEYDSNSKQFIQFKERVLNLPLIHAFGLYNAIDKSLKDSQLIWNKRFFEVEVDDPDYVQAGGSMMNRFNVISTIKSICTEFNITYKEAWQMSYALTQTNSLAKATQNYIQDQMRIIKEGKMRQQRANQT